MYHSVGEFMGEPYTIVYIVHSKRYMKIKDLLS